MFKIESLCLIAKKIKTQIFHNMKFKSQRSLNFTKGHSFKFLKKVSGFFLFYLLTVWQFWLMFLWTIFVLVLIYNFIWIRKIKLCTGRKEKGLTVQNNTHFIVWKFCRCFSKYSKYLMQFNKYLFKWLRVLRPPFQIFKFHCISLYTNCNGIPLLSWKW